MQLRRWKYSYEELAEAREKIEEMCKQGNLYDACQDLGPTLPHISKILAFEPQDVYFLQYEDDSGYKAWTDEVVAICCE